MSRHRTKRFKLDEVLTDFDTAAQLEAVFEEIEGRKTPVESSQEVFRVGTPEPKPPQPDGACRVSRPCSHASW
jgi:hypothetical protein